ncbi:MULTISPECIES: potassium channel family protein [unclassified Streptococcus]|uniref:potassium channel family protein n=1 Tax=unclassified Streptococcus TaxID=2608887 RepID=UPI0010729806|nr:MULTISPECIES: potassium channel family protein [unclassified Streptococcus]MBF0786361.1 potassium channel family protein [Streptococcus sp. 19428wC2_LYSM12]MCQ9212469.1 potassium channel family protein [Streptococcus sp. B01]MCQ9213808.1 potassium channel family protein [Streptococcus sp. O1]TFV06770.1 Ion channel protein [Streptococcus sp. LYSM12]
MLKNIINDSRYETGMIVMALLYVLLIVSEMLALISAQSIFYRTCDALLWGIFVFDYSSHLYYSDNKGRYIRNNILELIAIVPFVQVAAFFRIGRIARFAKLFGILKVTRLIAVSSKLWEMLHKLMNTNGLSKILVLNFGAVMVASGLLTLVEKQSFLNSLWWSIVTMTTVGYGDIVPRTAIAKLIAIVLMLIGILTFGMVTAIITRFFVDSERDAKIDGLTVKIEEQYLMLQRLEEKIDALSREKER